MLQRDTVVKAIGQFFPTVQIHGPYAFGAALIASTAYGLKRVWKPSETSICIANCNASIEIIFGDIFDQDGIRAIAVSEFFDTKLGRPVSDQSLHGVFLKKCFGGYQGERRQALLYGHALMLLLLARQADHFGWDVEQILQPRFAAYKQIWDVAAGK